MRNTRSFKLGAGNGPTLAQRHQVLARVPDPRRWLRTPQIHINLAPVVTVWAITAAERLGWGRGMSGIDRRLCENVAADFGMRKSFYLRVPHRANRANLLPQKVQHYPLIR